MNACMHTRTQTHTHVCVHTCTFQSCTFQSIQPPNQTTFYPRSWPKWWSGYSSISMMDEWGYLEIAELIRKIDLREPAKELRVRAMSGYGRVHDDNSPVSRGIINGKNLQYCKLRHRHYCLDDTPTLSNFSPQFCFGSHLPFYWDIRRIESLLV